MKRFLLALLGLGALTISPVLAQDAAQAAGQKPAEKRKRSKRAGRGAWSSPPAAPRPPSSTRPPPSRVIGADTIETSPAQNFGDLLRSTPGLNVIQTSARDINMTSRQSTSTLTNSQLVLLDGRSIYLDFFGLVLWDFVPQSPSEIKQIEVVRGPASAVWGANALTGVVNIITKSPARCRGLQPEPAGRALQPQRGLAQGRRLRLPLRRQLLLRPGPEREAGLAPLRRVLQLRSRSRVPPAPFPSTAIPWAPTPAATPRAKRGRQRLSHGRGALSRGPGRVEAASRTTGPASPRSTSGWTRSSATAAAAAASPIRAATRAPPASSTRASGPSRSRAARTWATARCSGRGTP